MLPVSIIVPVFNTEQYLEACLDSILKQSYTDFELIVVDDGSADGSGAICDIYAEEDSRVSVFHSENKGVSSARNLGLDVAKGRFVMFVDSDDVLPGDALANLVSEDVDFSVGGMLRILHGSVKEYRHQTDKYYRVGEKERFFDDAFSEMVLMEGPAAKLFRTEIIRRNGLRFAENLHYGEDKVFVFSFLLHAEAFRISTAIAYVQQRRVGSLSSNISGAEHLRPLMDFLKDFVAVVRVYQKEFFCQSVRDLYPVEVIRRYAYRYLTIVRSIEPKNLSRQDLLFISSLLKEDPDKAYGTDRAYLKSCVWVGRHLPDSSLFGFIRLVNTLC